MAWPTGVNHPRYKDGRSHHPLYGIWKQMIQRCTNPRASHYSLYGGRGIQVCERWRTSFWDYVADVGERPPGKSLDRIDNNGDYEPGNVRWASQSEQLLNRNRPDRCPRGHARTPGDSTHGCPECNRIRKAAWYQAHKTK